MLNCLGLFFREGATKEKSNLVRSHESLMAYSLLVMFILFCFVFKSVVCAKLIKVGKTMSVLSKH